MADAARGARRVLVVDDNAPLRASIERILASEGYVASGASAAEALATPEGAAPPDLLIADLKMPGVSGPELVDALRRRWPALTVLFISGSMGGTSRPSGPWRSVDGLAVLSKPFSLDDLLTAVASALSGEDPGARPP